MVDPAAPSARAHVVILSFEGPDPYANVGGLGVRVTELAHALGARGHEVDLFFVGDPHRPGVEELAPRVRLRRWCQWISAHHPAGVYDGEHGKINDFARSIPPFLIDNVIDPARRRGQRVWVLAEEWHTARATIALDWALRVRGLRDDATILWNANNTYGFETIDWELLRRAAAITTVSKYMKFELAAVGVPALVIPNGIPERLLEGPPPTLVDGFRNALTARPLLVKVGRYSPDKAWLQAIDAVALLRDDGSGIVPQLVVRGNNDPYGATVLEHARARGLRIADVVFRGRDPEDLFAMLAAARGDVIDLRAFLAEELLHALYAAADAVLANSRKEPFGLVGLEVMAAGGLAVCGATGEEYAEPFVNAIVCDTDDGRELAEYLRALLAQPALAHSMRAAARATASRFTWPTIIDTLERKIAFVEATRGVATRTAAG